jgi:adenylate kinase family enzyme
MFLKIIIVGNGGTGKSTLGEKLGKELNIPVSHLDRLGLKKTGYEKMNLNSLRSLVIS